MSALYPDFFFKFSSSKEESVKVLENEGSGWTSSELIYTRLLTNLEKLAEKLCTESIDKGVCIFLVGGPGNGKTEAAQFFLNKLFKGKVPKSTPAGMGRCIFSQPFNSNLKDVLVVEDATVLTKEQLIDDVKKYALKEIDESETKKTTYLCCINRGVLADTLNEIQEEQSVTKFISALSDIVSEGGTTPHMWPLKGNSRFKTEFFGEAVEHVYVWPMDVESLVDPNLYGGMFEKTPGYNLFKDLIDQVDVSKCETCLHQGMCPFFENLMELKNEDGIKFLVKSLRSYEIVTGRKIPFRELLSIANTLLVDAEDVYVVQKGDRNVVVKPCDWVARHVSILSSKDSVDSLASAFKLASRRYNQVLFGNYLEFNTKEMKALLLALRQKKEVEEFKRMARLLKAIQDFEGKRKNKTPGWGFIHDNFAVKMDVALEERIDELEQIEIAFCSSTAIGKITAITNGVKSQSLTRLLECLSITEENLGLQMIDISTETAEISRRSLQVLQVLGARMAKREVGAMKHAVYGDGDIGDYEVICGEQTSESIKLISNNVREPLRKVLSTESGFSAHVLQSIGQTNVSSQYVFRIKTEKQYDFSLKRSATLPIQPDAPVDSMPYIELSFNTKTNRQKSIKIPLTYDLFYALRRIKEGLNVASIEEQTFVALNLLSSKILGIISHNAEEPRFEFPESDEGQFMWLADNLIRKE